MKKRQLKIGPAIREIRGLQELSQQELKDRAELTQNYLSLIENDKRVASAQVLERIASALGVRESDIYILAEPDDSPNVIDQRQLKTLKKNVRDRIRLSHARRA